MPKPYMDDFDRFTRRMVIGTVIAIVMMILGIIAGVNYGVEYEYKLAERRCQEIAQTAEVEWQYSRITGCLVKINDQWIPLDNWRVEDND